MAEKKTKNEPKKITFQTKVSSISEEVERKGREHVVRVSTSEVE